MENNAGTLELIIGPMFSGKTNKLIQRYNEIKFSVEKLSSDNCGTTYSELPNEEILAINYDKDTRYGINQIISHDRQAIGCLSVNNLWLLQSGQHSKQLQEAKYIFINEAQFFGNLKEWVLEQVEKLNKHVILCGLDSDFKRHKFGDILDLIAHADSLVKLYGTCSKCTKPSIYTNRLPNNSNEQVLIGTDIYTPLCRHCYLTLNPQKYPTHVSVEVYRGLQADMAVLYITIIIGILLVSTCC